MEVTDFVESGGDFSMLYAGKIALEHADLVAKMIEDGILKKPKFLPSILKARV